MNIDTKRLIELADNAIAKRAAGGTVGARFDADAAEVFMQRAISPVDMRELLDAYAALAELVEAKREEAGGFGDRAGDVHGGGGIVS